MPISKELFDTSTKLLLEMAGREASDSVLKIYWKFLQYADHFAFKDACNYFASRCAWPKLEDFLFECNLSVPSSRKSREEAAKAAQDYKPKPAEPTFPAERCGRGMWAFYDDYETASRPSEEDVSKKLSHVANELLKLGWNVMKEEIHQGKAQRMDQRNQYEVWVNRVIVYAWRNEAYEPIVLEKRGATQLSAAS